MSGVGVCVTGTGIVGYKSTKEMSSRLSSVRYCLLGQAVAVQGPRHLSGDARDQSISWPLSYEHLFLSYVAPIV